MRCMSDFRQLCIYKQACRRAKVAKVLTVCKLLMTYVFTVILRSFAAFSILPNYDSRLSRKRLVVDQKASDQAKCQGLWTSFFQCIFGTNCFVLLEGG